MGCVNFGVPKSVVQWLRTTFHVSTFIETGTHLGATSAWASEHFDKVITIEGSEHYHGEAKRLHAHRANIQFLLGDSRELLHTVLGAHPAPAIFWLDAHWMGVERAYGKAAECPVLHEIAAVQQSGSGHFILIDDARFFCGPPPRPHEAADWPGIGPLLAALEPSFSGRYTVIHDDVLISVPASARTAAESYFQDLATEALQAAARPVPFLDKVRRALIKRLEPAAAPR